MQAKDIPDFVFLNAVREAAHRRGFVSATPWDVATVLAGHPELVGTPEATLNWPSTPPKVVLAKAKRLIRRGLMDGCTCGCRGDWEACG